MSNVAELGLARLRRVCVTIPTFRRLELLERLLDGVAGQALPEDSVVDVLVIDNDVRPSAQALVEGKRPGFPFALTYVHVQAPGLSSVRNFALQHVAGAYDYVAMIDDDEYPERHWLSELLTVARETGADAVIGPVPPALPADAPAWLRAGNFYDLPTYADRASIAFGYSGNCLLNVHSLRRFGLAFDGELNFAGGEDLLFFRQLLAHGGKLAYAAHATASERIGPERLRAAYLLKLNFRRGNTLALCDRRLRATTRGLAERALKGCARFGLGILTLVPLAIVNGKTGAMKALCNIARGGGTVAGLLGYVYEGYRRAAS
jgi:succinoglycan biosynthesis protein ExoM